MVAAVPGRKLVKLGVAESIRKVKFLEQMVLDQ